MLPKVTVIILNWNSYTVTAECLQSLRRSTYENVHFLLVDNGSRDGSAARLKREFAEIEVMGSPVNLGFTGGNNLGLRHALETDTAYAFLLNNDTVVDPEAIAYLIQALEYAPQAAMACPKIYFWEPPNVLWYAGGRLSKWRGSGEHVGRGQVDRGQFDRSCEVSFVTGCALMIRGQSLERLGLLDERLFAYAEDTDFSFRVTEAGYRMLYVPEARIWHKEGVAAKQNAGQALRIYYSTRNVLWVMHEHAWPFFWLGFVPYFLVDFIGRYLALSILHHESGIPMALVKGIIDFVRMRRGLIPRWAEK